ncbi:MAG: hypothetical protein WC881_01375 [Elusimicrobiota bacterium]|jgi:hypothetical protein
MAADTGGRFDRIEGAATADSARPALPGLNRFDHLEIGELAPAAPAAAPAADRMLCHHCGKPNEPQRADCWACHEALRHGPQAPPPADKPQPGQEITLVLDGFTYKSTDPNVPEDVRLLMDRIRSEGYSPELLADWRSWRATRNSGPVPDGSPDIKVFKGQRVSVIRIDGKVYTSDDSDLSPETRRLFGYLAEHGVTPALMAHLRQLGSQVKFRPADTACPSDGDLEFWKHVQGLAHAGPGSARPRPPRWDLGSGRTWLLIAAAALYILVRLLSR